MNINEVRKLLNDNNISAKKFFGQNFLIDNNIINNIIEESHINKDINVIEIGPGLGALTEVIIKKCHKLLCYEIDDNMVNILNKRFKEYDNIEIIQSDFLKCNLKLDIEKYFDNRDIYVISNLPYYITSSIILKLLDEKENIKQLTLMMQKEVADRICGFVSTKDYNALSVLVQYYSHPEQIINVSPSCFYPAPEVNSTVVRLKFYENKPFSALNDEYFKKFIRAIFHQKRKTLANNLKKELNYKQELIDKIFNELNLKQTARSEELTVEQIVDLANKFYLEVSNG